MSGVHKHPTISFRVSDREWEMIEAKILASGMQKKDYFVRSCIYNRSYWQIERRLLMSASKDKDRETWIAYIRYKDWKGENQVHKKRGFATKREALEYRKCKTFQNSKSQIVKPGDNIKFYMSAMDGGFSFEQIPISEEDLLLRIDQMEYAILYSRRFRMCDKDKKNTQLFSLMLPMRVYEDEMGNWKRG